MVQSSHKMYSNNILNFHVSTTILNACKKKKVWKLIKCPSYLLKYQYLKKMLLYLFRDFRKYKALSYTLFQRPYYFLEHKYMKDR